ncbi:MAG: DUF169 domain-containing protein [Dehalococcoidales bacterium]|jgi:uncharacterized protein (DUF169 family)|nr:DUF169 domain-containing protein [Dehalococcoidales bacterium]
MVNFAYSNNALIEILGLKYSPIAIKFFADVQKLDGFEIPPGHRYCQILMGAREGKKCLLTAENITCPAAAWAFGFKEPSPTLSSGEMPFAMGIFASPEAVKNTFSSMPRLETGKYRMVAACPLGESPFEPDVVVIDSEPEHLMWVALAKVFTTGGRLEFSTAVLQATCVDATVIPFLTGKMNANLGCYGCREATNLMESECVLGFPIEDLDEIVSSLSKLNEKAIPRVRAKTIYKALLSRSS